MNSFTFTKFKISWSSGPLEKNLRVPTLNSEVGGCVCVQRVELSSIASPTYWNNLSGIRGGGGGGRPPYCQERRSPDWLWCIRSSTVRLPYWRQRYYCQSNTHDFVTATPKHLSGYTLRETASRTHLSINDGTINITDTFNAAVNGHLELPLLKDRHSFDAVSTSNLEVYQFRDWWMLTYFIFALGESSLNNVWSMVNLERTCVLLFYYFLCLKANLGLEKTNQLGESSPNFIFAVVNLDSIILEKRWIDGESWPNNFIEKVNWGEDLRWVGSRCPLTHA